MRHELMLRAIETSIVKLLDGTRLTALEVRRLRDVIEANGPRRSVTSSTPKPEPDPAPGRQEMAEVVA